MFNGNKCNVTMFYINTIDDIEFPKFFPLVDAEICSGFVDYETKSENFTPVPLFVNGNKVYALKFRVDKRSVPSKLLNNEFEIALKKLIQQNEVVDDYGEVTEYVPSKSVKKELKAAIKHKLLRETAAVPSFYDVFINITTGIGYVSTVGKKDILELLNALENSFEVRVPYFGENDSEAPEIAFHEVIKAIYAGTGEENFTLTNNFKLVDRYDGKIIFADAEESETVNKLLAEGYEFEEAEIATEEETFKMKSLECQLYGHTNELMEESYDTIEENVSVKLSCLDSIFDKLDVLVSNMCKEEGV